MAEAGKKIWPVQNNQDAFLYLFTAVFILELIVGGVAFFYGIIHSAPEPGGGPPVARFPWLAWAVASVAAPAALLLIVHLASSLLSGFLKKEQGEDPAKSEDAEKNLPEGMRRFYACARRAPAIVSTLAVLAFGAAIFFIDGAFQALGAFAKGLAPHAPWIAGSLCAAAAVWFVTRALLIYRHKKLEKEYEWRREVLEKTGLVLVDKKSAALPLNAAQAGIVRPALEEGEQILDVIALPQTENGDSGNVVDEKNC